MVLALIPSFAAPACADGLHTTASPVSRAAQNGQRGVEPQRISLRSTIIKAVRA